MKRKRKNPVIFGKDEGGTIMVKFHNGHRFGQLYQTIEGSWVFSSDAWLYTERELKMILGKVRELNAEAAEAREGDKR